MYSSTDKQITPICTHPPFVTVRMRALEGSVGMTVEVDL